MTDSEFKSKYFVMARLNIFNTLTSTMGDCATILLSLQLSTTLHNYYTEI